jgi:hypothetical protein
MVVQMDMSSPVSVPQPNGGFYFVRACNRSLQAFQLLQQFLFVNPDLEDQEALGLIHSNKFCFFITLTMIIL